MTARLPRSYLYVPGNVPERFPKALASGADAMIIDFEDAVPVGDKETARHAAVRWLAGIDPGPVEVWVRVNPGDLGLDDIAELAGVSTVSGLVLAKADACGVAAVETELARRGADWMLSPLLETPGAVLDVRRIAAAPRVRRLQLGEYDLCAEIGVTPGTEESETAGLRLQVVLASADAGIDPPVAPVSVIIKDTGAFARSTALAKRQGFVGRACIHPDQLSTVHRAFSPTAEEVRAARAMLDVFARSRAAGSAVVLDANGRLVDEATIRTARRVLSWAEPRSACPG